MKQFFRPKHTLVFTSSTSTSTTTISRPFSSSSSSPASDSRSTICNPSTGALQLCCGKTRVANPSPWFHLPKTQLRTDLKPPKANQTLKRYLKSNSGTKALLLFRDILRKSPPSRGTQLHALVLKYGFESIFYLQTSLMNMYSAAGDAVNARLVFDEIPSKNVVCWTTMVSAYVDNQRPNEDLQLFRQMQMHNVEPDQVTLIVALSACADLGVLEMGEWNNAYVCHKYGFDTDLCLNNAPVNMYEKCGDIGTARRLFDNIREKDNKKNGEFGSALVVPNDVTFIGVLMACSHARMMEEGKRHFRSMSQEYGLKPREAHFGCMVDLFCRAGLLQEAYDFTLKMAGPSNAVVWRTLFGACSLQGDIKLGSQVRVKLLELEPSYVGDDVALSNIYAVKGMWDRKMIVRDQMKQRRSPGCSLIEVGRSISEFVSANVDHALRTEIYQILRQLIASIKAYGYYPELSSLKRVLKGENKGLKHLYYNTIWFKASFALFILKSPTKNFHTA
ncbi:pentatricopeptide repeat-containing protein [Pyrus ussuriensis x Pyrus communis]|uniref:Pentatricopeptide repeat-containing protein n=1 Tax=Pyrus ussuriensis x Pyrus communis TaxID=2448454 RepID=A0A5N5I144_9ROSA|nr:pentatricopeptide repeat-containing protein [Pyrus ussuriensis x Pyrus communis]